MFPIQSANYNIRHFKKKDLRTFTHYRADAEVEKYQSWEGYTYDDALLLFDELDYSKFGIPGIWHQLAITSKNSDTLLGDLAVHFIEYDQAEIGFTIAPSNQGNGIATEAVNQLLNFLFLSLNLHRVTAITDVGNIASYSLLEKLGFRREGHFVHNVFFKGKWCDELLYAKLRSEHLAKSSM